MSNGFRLRVQTHWIKPLTLWSSAGQVMLRSASPIDILSSSSSEIMNGDDIVWATDLESAISVDVPAVLAVLIKMNLYLCETIIRFSLCLVHKSGHRLNSISGHNSQGPYTSSAKQAASLALL